VCRGIILNHLQPGAYRLAVQATNGEGNHDVAVGGFYDPGR
jgi:hypothetical protein